MKEEIIKLQVDFFARGFRSGIIEVPKEVGLFNQEERRIIITEKLIERLSPDIEWKFDSVYDCQGNDEKCEVKHKRCIVHESYFAFFNPNTVRIITCKVLTKS